MLVHCNNGLGASGTLVAILAQMVMVKKAKRTPASIFSTVNFLRQYRHGLVETIA